MGEDFAISEEDLKFFIEQYFNQTGKFPKFEELIAFLRFSTSSSVDEIAERITELIESMVERGILSWENDRLRLNLSL